MFQLPISVSKQLDKQAGDKTLHAQFILTAYYAAPENAATPQQPGAPAPNGQPAPAGQPAPPPAAPAPAAK